MTKRRPPLTFENALTRVAAVIGWDETAVICGFAERTVRNWSEPDTTAAITLEAALKLDVAYRAAIGGEEAPFLTCYATRLNAETLAATVGREALLAGVAKAARESGEAVAATLAAAHPGATPADIRAAERELEESICAQTTILARVRAAGKSLFGRGASGTDFHTSGGDGLEPTRAPEVVPTHTG